MNVFPQTGDDQLAPPYLSLEKRCRGKKIVFSVHWNDKYKEARGCIIRPLKRALNQAGCLRNSRKRGRDVTFVSKIAAERSAAVNLFDESRTCDATSLHPSPPSLSLRTEKNSEAKAQSPPPLLPNFSRESIRRRKNYNFSSSRFDSKQATKQ